MKKHSLKRLMPPGAILLGFILVAFNTDDLLRQFGFDAIETIGTVLKYTVEIGLWFSAAFFLHRLTVVLFWDGLVARTIKGQVPRLLKNITGLILYIIASTGVVAVVFEKPVTGFWATSGVLGIVLGFALRNIILDLFTGIAVNVDRPYSMGDWIMITDNPGTEENLVGCVHEVNWRTTRLKTTTNNMLVIPNSVMGQKVITNFMAPGERSRFQHDFTVDFSVPSERVIRVMTAAARAVAGQDQGPLEDPPAKVRVTGINEYGVQYRIRYWIIPRLVSPSRARNTVISSILKHLHQAGITLAYPKQDTYHAKMPKRQLETEPLEDRRELLSRISWFDALKQSEIESLAEGLETRHCSQGSELHKEGEDGSSMFVMVEGLAEGYAYSSEHNQEVRVNKYVPGDFFGEMSLLTGSPRPLTIRAATATVLYEITRETMSTLFEARPELAEAISEVLAERRTQTEHAIDEFSPDEPEEKKKSAAAKILDGIKSFFKDVLQR